MHLHVLVRFQSAGMAREHQSPGMGLSDKSPGMAMPGLSESAAGFSRDISMLSPREVIGRAKKHSSFVLRHAGMTPSSAGGIWAARGQIVPVRDEHHHEQVRRYIQDHAADGAVVGQSETSPGMAMPGL
jgi:hypothetical protein